MPSLFLSTSILHLVSVNREGHSQHYLEVSWNKPNETPADYSTYGIPTQNFGY
jgi:hypothetical protein